MRNIVPALLLCLGQNLVTAGILFTNGADSLQAITFTEDISFLVESSASDLGFAVILKDVYKSDVEVESGPYMPNEAQLNSRLNINQELFSAASLFRAYPVGFPDPLIGDGFSFTPRDIIINYAFNIEHWNPFEINPGDTITIQAGTIFDISGETAPNPDNIGGLVRLQIFPSENPTFISAEKEVVVIPEAQATIALLGLIALIFVTRNKVLTSRWW